ncbi:YfcE family phosphodiesterase [Weissella diestrammenae]|uniref:Phosphoesterase n=1 Tax=Weissella diestrammenae TaxID=1162633 RepID=A0A7G9T5S5_9LACO|nr:YfcE family phosphodiesterase [Weissella diestrammenae]MCM0582278.1 YfcE family phosphodiesterase [Weissella diestrammenae]QNN75450.1 YfcE family phosphodiesterase [Weissella diestrammenae]
MDYLFVSDAHGDRAVLGKIVTAYQNKVHAIFYNGDSELPADDELFNTMLPVIGNMDFDAMFPDDRQYHDATIDIYQTHGHLYQTELNLNQIRQKVSTLNIEVVTLGHTHQLGAEVIDNKLFINPGSIALPKGPYAYIGGTFAILTVTADTLQVQFYNRDLRAVPELQFSFPR